MDIVGQPGIFVTSMGLGFCVPRTQIQGTIPPNVMYYNMIGQD